MLKLGEKIISDIYLGDKKISKVFLGDKLLYQANKPIFLDYISFDGNSWIDVDYIPSSNTRVVGKVSFTAFKGSGANYVFGVFGGGANFGLNIGSNRAILNVPWGSASAIAISNPNNLGQVYSFDISKNGAYIDGVLKLTTSQLSATFTATKSFFVGWSNGTGTEKLIGNIYPMQMYENDVLVKDIRPCLDPNGVVCLYDMVTKKYHYNIGTGTLTAGNVINFVDYIESDGNCYINTNVFADNTYTFDTTVAFVKENYNCVPWGVRSSGTYTTENSQCYLNSNTYGNSTTREIKLYSTSVSLATNWSSGIIPEIDKVYELKGMTVVPTMTTMKYPIILFGLNNIGTINTSVGVCRIYKWTAYSNGVVVKDLRPCVVAGEAGLYDMVTGNLFYNKGTGTLGYDDSTKVSITVDADNAIITLTDFITAFITVDVDNAYIGVEQ